MNESGASVRVKHDAQMHQGQNRGKRKNVNKKLVYRLNKNRRKFIIFAEIRVTFMNFVKIWEYASLAYGVGRPFKQLTEQTEFREFQCKVRISDQDIL